MKTPKHSLRKIVTFLNNPDEDGGFWLPNIQRPFVWTEEQICRLFDSILREYPISTLLVWKTKSTIRRRKFIDNYRDGIRLTDFYVPEDDRKKCLVLDGQQRLQSLYIGLCGSYGGRELCFNILSGDVAAPDDVKFKFSFLDPAKVVFPWVRFKDLVFSRDDPLTAAEKIIEKADGTIPDKAVEKSAATLASLSALSIATTESLIRSWTVQKTTPCTLRTTSLRCSSAPTRAAPDWASPTCCSRF